MYFLSTDALRDLFQSETDMEAIYWLLLENSPEHIPEDLKDINAVKARAWAQRPYVPPTSPPVA